MTLQPDSQISTAETGAADTVDADAGIANTDLANTGTDAIPASAAVAIAFVLGIVAAERFAVSGNAVLIAAAIVIAAAMYSMKRAWPRVASIAVLLLMLLAGAMRWNVSAVESDRQPLRDLCQNGSVTVRLTARISSVPVVHLRPASLLSPRIYGSDEQTRFLVDVLSIATMDGDVSVSGRCRVYVDGNAAAGLTCDDIIRLTGTLDWPVDPGNPGEFNFPEYLRRQDTAGLIYIDHAQAIEVLHAAGRTSSGYWLTLLRHQAQSILQRQLTGESRSVAMALLLGDRNELTSDVETAFISSGAMHLLAISGLHVGILCLFLMRTLHLLLVPWNKALLVTAVICVLYALVTDLRPSVVRATVFFLLFVTGQLACREVSTTSLLSLTAIVMLLWQPQLVFDTGAWLSFLSVAALGWVSSRNADDDTDREAPPDALTLRDRLRDVGRVIAKRLVLRYRQMLCILALTTPLVASEFHVVSPVGLLINVLLIPFTAVALVLGFTLLLTGFLLPIAAPLPGVLFSGALQILLAVVHATARWNVGHVYIADLPPWFVPAFYVLLVTAVVSWRPLVRQASIIAVLSLVIAAFAINGQLPQASDVRCTVLDVGHGSAAVVESGDGRVLLIDAGAMNRGDRAADVVCRFLWHRGYRRLDGILISHADMDHFNALEGIVHRMPVGQLLLAQDFLHNDSPAAAAVLQVADSRRVPVRVAVTEDTCRFGSATLTLFQADLSALPPDIEDNEKSLLVLLKSAGRTICFPGDLEGDALNELLPRMGDVDVLISPHHGSKTANTTDLANAVNPDHVIVSARDSQASDYLHKVYAASQSILFTSDAGAVTVVIREDGNLSVDGYRDRRLVQNAKE
ncbi:MAG: DNA internalization-related competence protein ComEC/Rec2 [Planctomycetaceae bacterium]